MEIVIASSNLHKIREFRDMLKGLKHIEILSLKNFPHYVPLGEDKATFKDNAISKAEHAAKTLNKWVLADDSGLVVPAINGEPGVYSRRYAGTMASDGENRKKLLERMLGLHDEQRFAYYECSLALAGPAGLKKSVTGTCEGVIIDYERGSHGFGYDSLFVKHDYDKTFGEIEESVKNRISHRRKAFEKIALTLEVLRG